MNVAARTTYISISTGSGMLDVGFELAFPQARPICYVEREAAAAAVVVARIEEGALADAPVWSDLRTFDHEPWRGRVGWLIGGIPCQGNSLAGKRRLESDERNLWPNFWRLALALDCDGLVLENVPGIAIPGASGQRAPADGILQDLAEGGWDAEWLRLPASAVGASHQRERFFIMAIRVGVGLQAQQSKREQFGSAEGGVQLADAIGSRPQGESAAGSADPDDAHAGRSSGADLLFAPSPSDPRWGEILQADPALEPAICRMADGLASWLDLARADRLRLTGNGVVPLQAALAMHVLSSRLGLRLNRSASPSTQ